MVGTLWKLHESVYVKLLEQHLVINKGSINGRHIVEMLNKY
jgi:hypothetical protein